MRSRRRTWVAYLLGLSALMALAWQPAAHAATPAQLLDSIKSEAEYILSMRNGEGIITTVPTRDKVVPYHANFATMGLARAYGILRDSRYSTAAWRWLQWYRDHMEPNGTIADHIFVGSWIPVGLPDSTDAYAGTYLSAVLETFQATLDIQRLNDLKGAVLKAVAAIELTVDDDGLHFARPGWPFKYSMDEAEAYAGFLAAAELGGIYRDKALTDRARGNAERLLAGANRPGGLIDPVTGLYLWALHDDGTRVVAPIAWIYPGASAQAWAVADGLATGANAITLMSRLESAQPQWDTPTATTTWYDGHPTCAGVTPCRLPTEYWPRFAIAYLKIGQPRRAMDAAVRIRSSAVFANRAYPFTPGDAGQLLLVFSDPDVIAAAATPAALR